MSEGSVSSRKPKVVTNSLSMYLHFREMASGRGSMSLFRLRQNVALVVSCAQFVSCALGATEKLTMRAVHNAINQLFGLPTHYSLR